MDRSWVLVVAAGLAVGCSDGGRHDATGHAAAGAAAPSLGAPGRVARGVAAEELRFTRAQGAWHAVNRATGLRAALGTSGVAVESRTGWRVTLSTASIGRPGAMRALPEVEPREGRCDDAIGPTADGACVRRMELDRGRGLVEIWRNTARGLEQSFEIDERPVGGGPLSIVVGTSPCEARLAADALLLSSGGTDLVRYGELRAWDASGRVLPARLQWRAGRVSLVIDDEGARYPVLVDPLLTDPAWIGESEQVVSTFGSIVSNAGDVNGDGFDDVVVHGYMEEAYVFHGSAQGLGAVAAWRSTQAGANTLSSAAAAGDVNGDGFDDLIVGNEQYDHGQNDEGGAWLYLGSAQGLQVDPAWTAEPDQASSGFGSSVAGAGDVDGDGFADVIIGAARWDNGQQDEGRAVLYLGSAQGLELVPAWTAEPNQTRAIFGCSVAGAGDVDGDGYDDVIVGAWGYDSGAQDLGGAFVYHGGAGGLSAVADWTAVSGQTGSKFGFSVAGAGDVNGDGFDDVIVGADDDDHAEQNDGRAFVYHGSAGGLGGVAAWTGESNQAGANYGRSVSGAGDVDGDGFDDVIVGAEYYSNGQNFEGLAYAYHGSADGLAAVAAWTGESNQMDAAYGYSVSGAGDVNGDGYDDAIVGAPYWGGWGAWDGKAFLYLGAGEDGAPCPGGLWRAGVCDLDYCYIDATWYADGAASPGDACEACVVATSRIAWSPVAEGAACAGGLCRAGACDLGSCYIGAAWTADGAANAGNECEACVVATSRTAWTDDAEGTVCAGGLCRAGACDAASCRIGGAWVADGTANAGNECEACVVAASRTAWTDDAEGTACAGGLCRAGSCDAVSCRVGGAWRADGAANPDNECEACVVAANRTAWTDDADGAACVGGLCRAGACDGASCRVAGAWWADGAQNPGNPCEACAVAGTRTDWSVQPEGTACPEGLCRAGGCEAGRCYIGARWFDDGTANPDDDCALCAVQASRTAWTDEVAGTACATDGLTCTTDACDGAGACRHEVAQGCLVDGACFAEGEGAPQESCGVCRTAESTTAFAAEPDGTACDDGLAFTQDDECQAGHCVGWEEGACDEPLAEGAVPIEATGSTDRRPSHVSRYGEGCAGVAGAGSDVVHAVEVLAGHRYRAVVLPGADFDAVVAITVECADLVGCLGAADDGGRGAEEAVVFTASEDGEVLVVIDAARDGESGDYDLLVEEIAAGEDAGPGDAGPDGGAQDAGPQGADAGLDAAMPGADAGPDAAGPADAGDDHAGGCSCRTTGSSGGRSGGLPLLVGGVLAAMWRRRRPRSLQA